MKSGRGTSRRERPALTACEAELMTRGIMQPPAKLDSGLLTQIWHKSYAAEEIVEAHAA
jgi:hypothetical protein